MYVKCISFCFSPNWIYLINKTNFGTLGESKIHEGMNIGKNSYPPGKKGKTETSKKDSPNRFKHALVDEMTCE